MFSSVFLFCSPPDTRLLVQCLADLPASEHGLALLLLAPFWQLLYLPLASFGVSLLKLSLSLHLSLFLNSSVNEAVNLKRGPQFPRIL